MQGDYLDHRIDEYMPDEDAEVETARGKFRCAACGLTVYPGTEIIRTHNGYVHIGCED